MAYEIKWSERAFQSLKDNFDFIARDSASYAKVFASEILRRIDVLKLHPYSGRILPEINKKEYRELVFGNYRIIYKVQEVMIEILLIRHGAKEIDLDSL